MKIEQEKELILTPKHEELIKRLQTLFPEAFISINEYIPLKNVWNVTIGQGPGVEFLRVLRPYEDDTKYDFSQEIKQILLNSGFIYAGYYSSFFDDYPYEEYAVYRFCESESIKYFLIWGN